MDNHLPDFLVIPSILIKDRKLQPLDGQVYGVIYWYTRLKLQKCILSNSAIAKLLNVKTQSIVNSVVRLKKRKYIHVIMDDHNHRIEIIPLLSFTPPNLDPNSNELPPTSNELGGYINRVTPPTSNELHNKNILIRTSNKKVITQKSDLSAKEEKPIKIHERKPPDKQTQLQKICYYLEDTLNTRIVNWGKQAKALKMMLQAGYNEKQILFTIKYMANKDEFYEDKGFDLMTVANNIAQVKASVRKAVKDRVPIQIN